MNAVDYFTVCRATYHFCPFFRDSNKIINIWESFDVDAKYHRVTGHWERNYYQMEMAMAFLFFFFLIWSVHGFSIYINASILHEWESKVIQRHKEFQFQICNNLKQPIHTANSKQVSKVCTQGFSECELNIFQMFFNTKKEWSKSWTLTNPVPNIAFRFVIKKFA